MVIWAKHWSGKLFTSEKQRKVKKRERDEREVVHSKTAGI